MNNCIIIFFILLLILLLIRYFIGTNENFKTDSGCPPGPRGKKCRKEFNKYMKSIMNVTTHSIKKIMDSTPTDSTSMDSTSMDSTPIRTSTYNTPKFNVPPYEK